MGFVHPNRVLTKAGAQPGDVLILTKPLGVGIITTALKRQVADPNHTAAAVESMKKLSRRAARLSQQVGVHACTDITGFALLGHAQEMAEKSGAGIRFYLEKLPFLEGARGYAEDRLFPGGACRNQEHYAPQVRFAADIPEEMQLLLFTPETSGGLLIAVPSEKLEGLTTLFGVEGQEHWVIGEVVEGEGIEVV